jgi:hypothetical protein
VANYGTVGGTYQLFPAIGSVSVVTSNLVEAYLVRVDGRIDARLAANYGDYLPMSVASAPVLREIAETWTIALLLRRFFTQEKENASEWVKSWFEDVDAMLKPFETGSAQLLPGTMDTGGSSGLILSNVSGYRPTFDVGPMEETTVDPNRLLDIQNRNR